MGSGADVAWFDMAVNVEHEALFNTRLVGGSADIQKAFDEIQ